MPFATLDEQSMPAVRPEGAMATNQVVMGRSDDLPIQRDCPELDRQEPKQPAPD